MCIYIYIYICIRTAAATDWPGKYAAVSMTRDVGTSSQPTISVSTTRLSAHALFGLSSPPRSDASALSRRGGGLPEMPSTGGTLPVLASYIKCTKCIKHIKYTKY